MKIRLGINGICFVDHRFLLGQRDEKDRQPGIWCTPGGGVEFGETLDEALQREYREEVGLDCTVPSSWTSVQEFIAPEKHAVIVFKEVHVKNFVPLIIGDGFQAVEWFHWGEIQMLNQERKITPMSYRGLEAWRNFNIC